MKKSFNSVWFFLAITLASLQGCDNDGIDPNLKDIVQVEPAADIGAFSATVHVTIKTAGIFTVIEKGVCWDVNKKPDITDNRFISITTTPEFSFTLYFPEDNKDYYLRPYFKDDFGNIIYGNEITFKTLKDLEVSITSQPAQEVTENSAVIATSISTTGTGTIAARGLCWSVQENPTLDDSTAQAADSVAGDFTVELKGLTPNKKYFARAYATSAQGQTTYGNQVSFTTLTAPNITVTTNEVVPSSTTATTGGTITGTGTVGIRGVCINKTGNPTILENKTSDGTGTGAFVSSLTGLTPGTIYYVRAFATTNLGQTVYGNQLMFVTTQSGSTFTFSTKPLINITSTTALAQCDLQGQGIVGIRGFCWSTASMPSIADAKLESGAGLGAYYGKLTGLAPGTRYYVRPYAITSAGTIYGSQVSFDTSDLLTVSTNAISSITESGAVSGGDISGIGIVSARGVCWSKNSGPTTANSKTIDGSGQGNFVSTLKGLEANTQYYVRAYATSASGTTYGTQHNFTTKQIIPEVLTTAVSGITLTSAVSGGTITGTVTILARGICWSTSQVVSIADNKTTDGAGRGSFTSTMTGLTRGTMYFVRSYATDNSGVTYYGPLVSFNTAVEFTLQTRPAYNITSSTAISSAIITGPVSLSTQGICWSTLQNPTTRDDVVVHTGVGGYSSQMTGLTSSTTYYVRAFVNTKGGVTVYGNEISFTTLP